MGSRKAVLVGVKKHELRLEAGRRRSKSDQVVYRKMEKLQRIVRPGGEQLQHLDNDIDELLLHTVDYILHLRSQVAALEQALLFSQTN